jgi:hypothetical protein
VTNPWLAAGGMMSLAAAIAHPLCIIGGAAWYRFFGAGERMARAVEQGRIQPALVTAAIAATLLVWAVDALSGAGWLGRLPLLRPVLVAIAGVYLLRAAALPVMLATMAERGRTFLRVSSAIVPVIGVVHAWGIYRGWRQLA